MREYVLILVPPMPPRPSPALAKPGAGLLRLDGVKIQKFNVDCGLLPAIERPTQ